MCNVPIIASRTQHFLFSWAFRGKDKFIFDVPRQVTLFGVMQGCVVLRVARAGPLEEQVSRAPSIDLHHSARLGPGSSLGRNKISPQSLTTTYAHQTISQTSTFPV